MNTNTVQTRTDATHGSSATRTGAWVGFAIYLAVGVWPTLIFSGLAGAGVAAGVLGRQLDTGWLERGIVWLVMGIAVALGAALFAAAGAGVGRLLGGARAVAAAPAPGVLARFSRPARIGGGIGLGLFLLFGLVPTLVYGGFGLVGLTAGMLGEGLFGRLSALLATVLLTAAVAAIFTLAGAGIGRALAVVTARPVRHAQPAQARVAVKRRKLHREYSFVGGIVGLVSFLFVGLLPSLVYGGFAGATLAAGLFGHPLGDQLLPRLVVGFGMLVGVLGTGALFVVCGAAVGAGIHALVARRVDEPEDQGVAHVPISKSR